MKIIEAFSKSFLLAYFLPSATFILMNYSLYLIILKQGRFNLEQDVQAVIKMLDNSLLIFFLFTGLMSFGFNSGNYSILRLFEGYKLKYLFCLSWFWHFVRRGFLHWRLDRWLTKLENTTDLAICQRSRQKVNRIRAILESKYPKRHEDLLPTGFGNVFRSFEDYPREKYGIEPQVIWQRISMLLPVTSQKFVEDAQTAMMFFVTCSFLLYVFTIEAVIACAFAYNAGWYEGWKLYPLIKMTGFSFISAFFLYRISIETAYGFGEAIKSIFDVQRKLLLRELSLPLDLSLGKEKPLWRRLSTFYGERETQVRPFA